MVKLLEKNIHGESLIFTNRRAVYWPRERALVISDVHVGKSAHFRRSGIAVSSQVLLDDLAVLEELVNFFSAESIIVVGDLFHAGQNSDLDIFCKWRNSFSHLQFILIKGNHDRIANKFYQENCITAVETSLRKSPFTFIHEPLHVTGEFTISGHIHPGVVLSGQGRQMIKLPCFAFSDKQLILPAFSRFTGLDTKTLGRGFRHIAFSEGIIFDY